MGYVKVKEFKGKIAAKPLAFRMMRVTIVLNCFYG